jgi:hypothetical protein
VSNPSRRVPEDDRRLARYLFRASAAIQPRPREPKAGKRPQVLAEPCLRRRSALSARPIMTSRRGGKSAPNSAPPAYSRKAGSQTQRLTAEASAGRSDRAKNMRPLRVSAVEPNTSTDPNSASEQIAIATATIVRAPTGGANWSVKSPLNIPKGS